MVTKGFVTETKKEWHTFANTKTKIIMPRQQPTQSYQRIRDYTEKWTWCDNHTGLMTTGYNPPTGAQDCRRVPFHIRYVTKGGRLEMGNAVCLKVDRRRHLRTIQFVESQAIRSVWDFLVIEVDGTRFRTH